MGKAYRFVALRYRKKHAGGSRRAGAIPTVRDAGLHLSRLRHQPDGRDDLLVWFYSQRGGAENLIKEANNDAGLAAYPSARWAMNCIISSWPCWPTT